MELGRLQKIDLRSQWKNEGLDFTPWLAKEENIALLSETIGIELEVQSSEEFVGPFRADILCVDTTDNHYVLIENQLEKTDHIHLGQLMTYAAGLNAVTIIWIAQKFTEEHRAALDWLNSITDDTFNFFGIEIELYRIGNSAPAPMFNIVSKPNDWAKAVKKTANNQPITETKQLQQEYWQALKDFIEENKAKFRMQKPLPQHWTNIALGRSNFYLSATCSTRDNTLGIWLNILGERAKENFDKLSEIAKENSLIEISPNLQWSRLDERKSSYVILTTNGDISKKENWNEQFNWFKNNIELFIKYFKPIISKI